jgi:hypothetical protein
MVFVTHTLLPLLLIVSIATALPSSLKRGGVTTRSTSTATGDGAVDNQELVDALILAPTAVDRIALIPDDTDFVYSFQSPPSKKAITSGGGGRTVRSDRKVFPPLVGTGGKTKQPIILILLD